MAIVGFDSSVLSPFARARRLDVLERLTARHARVTTPAVLGEIDRAVAMYPDLATVRTASWLQVVHGDSVAELVTFDEFVRILGGSSRNLGEASLLAWAKHAGGVAILDDHGAVNAAKSKQVPVRRSLALLCEGLQAHTVTMAEASAIIDDVQRLGGARLPCDGAGFAAWAEANGLFVPDT